MIFRKTNSIFVDTIQTVKLSDQFIKKLAIITRSSLCSWSPIVIVFFVLVLISLDEHSFFRTRTSFKFNTTSHIEIKVKSKPKVLNLLVDIFATSLTISHFKNVNLSPLEIGSKHEKDLIYLSDECHTNVAFQIESMNKFNNF